jgi:hypothetical protein
MRTQNHYGEAEPVDRPSNSAAMKKSLLVTVDLQVAETTDHVASILHLVASSLEKVA